MKKLAIFALGTAAALGALAAWDYYSDDERFLSRLKKSERAKEEKPDEDEEEDLWQDEDDFDEDAYESEKARVCSRERPVTE
jgi:hypothetical protein